MSHSHLGKSAGPSPLAMPEQPRPDYLARLDGLCRPCADAEFYGLRMQHALCEHGDCACSFEIPEVWPEGTWPVQGVPAELGRDRLACPLKP